MLVYDIESIPEGLTIDDVYDIASEYEVVLWSSRTRNGVKPCKPYVLNEEEIKIVKVETKLGKRYVEEYSTHSKYKNNG